MTVLALTVVHHEDPHAIGARALVPGGSPLVLGRAGAPLPLDHALVSRRHAEVSRAGAAVRVRDLRSRNGTFVDGARIEQAELREGDVLTIGPALLLLHRVVPDAAGEPHPKLAGASAALRDVLDQVRLVAPRDLTVLVLGETGVGKELVAREIHACSGRTGALVAVDCGALAEGVLQSELFGHARGAFSGADRARGGLVEAAAGGTLFLDEIGDAPPPLQASLLRLLEAREYRPVGTDEVRTTDARVVAATQDDLGAKVADGRFRRDLAARLGRWTIRVPPLRERREDVLPIALRSAERAAGGPTRIDRDLALALLLHDWPENVRELDSVVQQATIEARDGVLTLTPRVRQRLRDGRPKDREPPAAPEPRPTADDLRRRFLEVGGNARALARALGVDRSTLYRWFREDGLDPRALRREA